VQNYEKSKDMCTESLVLFCIIDEMLTFIYISDGNAYNACCFDAYSQ